MGAQTAMTLIRTIALVSLVSVGAVGAEGTASPRLDNLRRDADVVVVGPTVANERTVMNAAGGGDVSGDGIPDLIVTHGHENTEEQTRGDTYVIFGKQPMPERIDLSEGVDWGFVIRGAKDGDWAFEAASAGDVNGDGLEDIIVGAWGADNNLRSDSGSAYVVFGKADHLAVELALFDAGLQGPLGFRIDGPSSGGIAGEEVDGVGDMNGDGFDDVLVASPYAGRTYVVWGKPDPMSVDLLLLETEVPPQLGFRIETSEARDYLFYSASAAGDVNGDGTPDVVVQAACRGNYACARVIFGKADSAPVRVSRLGQGGFMVRDAPGWAVSEAGDVDGDGLDDVVFGARSPGCCGHAYIVFGKRSSKRVSVLDLEGKGYRITGAERAERLGSSVALVGDINGDSRDDLILGATGANSSRGDGTSAKGAAHVVFGKRSAGTVSVGSLGRRGYRMNGGRRLDFAGLSVAGIGDLNGDGVPDVMVGSVAGHVYVVFGRR